MRTTVLGLLCAGLLAGCASAAALRDMQKSREAYRACLTAAPKLEDCERERRLFEADLAAIRVYQGPGAAVLIAPMIPAPPAPAPIIVPGR